MAGCARSFYQVENPVFFSDFAQGYHAASHSLPSVISCSLQHSVMQGDLHSERQKLYSVQIGKILVLEICIPESLCPRKFTF